MLPTHLSCMCSWKANILCYHSLTGDGITELPVQRMCLIDLSISQEGVIDTILFDVMKIERPEFEGQKKSIEGDLLHQQHELNKEQVHANLCMPISIIFAY